jgi:superoxide dismutase, Fe-Mn family
MYEEKTFPCIGRDLPGISKVTMDGHYKLYQGYVKKANEILEKLSQVDRDPAKANQVYSDIRELKVELSFALGGIKNHEIYFSHLGGNGTPPDGNISELLNRDFGSFEAWMQDMKATGIAARGWAWLGYDWGTKAFFNYIGDAQNSYPIWNVTPLVALDVYEHAYWADYGPARSDYIDAFFANLDWPGIESKWDAMNSHM